MKEPEEVGGQGDSPNERQQGVRVEDKRAAEATMSHLTWEAFIQISFSYLEKTFIIVSFGVTWKLPWLRPVENKLA